MKMESLGVYVLLFLQSVILTQSQELAQTPVVPRLFIFPTLGALAINGSSSVSNCSSVTLNSDGTSTCSNPASSVLFDGNIPILPPLEGDSWASQLMILQQFGRDPFKVTLNFARQQSDGRLEVTILNCPRMGTGVLSITVSQDSISPFPTTFYPTLLSCNSLLRVCIPLDAMFFRRITISFRSFQQKVHLAEIEYYEDSNPCPLFTTIPGLQSPMSTEPGTEAQSLADKEAVADFQTENISLLSVLVAVVILQTLLVLLVAVVLLVMAYKQCRKKEAISLRK